MCSQPTPMFARRTEQKIKEQLLIGTCLFLCWARLKILSFCVWSSYFRVDSSAILARVRHRILEMKFDHLLISLHWVWMCSNCQIIVSFFLSLSALFWQAKERNSLLSFFTLFWRLTPTTIGSVWFLLIREMTSFFCQFYSWKSNKEELLYQDVCIMRRERETTTNVTITSQWK